MGNTSLLDLVLDAFPRDINVAAFMALSPKEMWAVNPREACYKALSKCAQIDWDAYRETYMSEEPSDKDAVLHFIRDGVFEKRKLYLKRLPNNVKAPKISVVVSNYNNSIYLEKTVGSLLTQTLQDIEIIVVDDASTDDSLAVLARIEDPRLKIVASPANQATHMTRKLGVDAATGEYLMFLDGDDFYFPHACETAYNAIRKGYDVVSFGTQIIPVGTVSEDIQRTDAAWINGGKTGEYIGSQIMSETFFQNTGLRTLWNKIYCRELAQKSFAEMETGRMMRSEDRYEIFVLLANAKSMLKIDAVCYAYRYRHLSLAIDNMESESKKVLIEMCNVAPLQRFAQKRNLTEYLEPMINSQIRRQVQFQLDRPEGHDIKTPFHEIADTFGPDKMVAVLAGVYGKDIEKVAGKLRQPITRTNSAERHRNIGILYGELGNGGAEKVVIRQANMLADAGFHVVLLLSTYHENQKKLDERVIVVYLPDGNYDIALMSRRFSIFEDSIRKYELDIVISHNGFFPSFYWDMLFLQLSGVPFIYYHHSAFYRRLVAQDSNYPLHAFLSAACCADKVLCLSRFDELFFRCNGVNAEKINNPVEMPASPPRTYFHQTRKHIIAVGRLGERVKCMGEALKVVREVKRIIPLIHITFVGSFASAQARKDFLASVSSLGLNENIELTGWVENPEDKFSKAALMLSTSFTEAFPLAVAEAQANGLPCVIYDLPITLCEDNPSIIRVPQGDYKAAAREIVALLEDEARWHSLSRIALENTHKFSPSSWFQHLLQVMNNFATSSPVTYYTREDYEKTLRTLSWYACQRPPWQK